MRNGEMGNDEVDRHCCSDKSENSGYFRLVLKFVISEFFQTIFDAYHRLCNITKEIFRAVFSAVQMPFCYPSSISKHIG